MRMLLPGLILITSLAWLPAHGQSPLAIKYCRDLAAAYRKAIADGKPPVPDAGQAAANCPTNPPDSIAVLESALQQLKVELPSR